MEPTKLPKTIVLSREALGFCVYQLDEPCPLVGGGVCADGGDDREAAENSMVAAPPLA
jgi:hypothetical protein